MSRLPSASLVVWSQLLRVFWSLYNIETYREMGRGGRERGERERERESRFPSTMTFAFDMQINALACNAGLREGSLPTRSNSFPQT